jgi:hypothetical protein
MADMVDETETVDKVSTWGGIPAKNSKGENLLLFIGNENLLLFIGKEQQGGEPPSLHRSFPLLQFVVSHLRIKENKFSILWNLRSNGNYLFNDIPYFFQWPQKCPGSSGSVTYLTFGCRVYIIDILLAAEAYSPCC